MLVIREAEDGEDRWRRRQEEEKRAWGAGVKERIQNIFFSELLQTEYHCTSLAFHA